MSVLKAVIYARFSSHNQNEMSIKAQVRACREYAQTHNMDVIEIYADEAKSATTTMRPDFQRMLTDSLNKEFSVILVHKLDRFARNKNDSVMCKAMLEKNGVHVVSVTEQFDDSPEGCIMESMVEAIAQYYSMNLGREVKKGQREAALQRQFLGGVPPLGYKVQNQRLVIDEFNAKAIRMIFDMYCNGYSYNKIANALNKKGYKTQRGNTFSKNSIRNILMNERYTGVYIYNQRKGKSKYNRTRNNSAYKDDSEIIRIEGGIPQIIDKKQFAKAQQLLKEHEHLKGGKKYRYLLSGKVHCACGGTMCGNTRKSGRNKIQHSYYRCNKCNQELNVLYLDEFVIKSIRTSIIHSFDKSLSRLTKAFNNYVRNKNGTLNGELHSIKMSIDGNRKKIENLVDKLSDMEAKDATAKVLLKKINDLEETTKYLMEQEKDLEASINVKYSKEQVNGAMKQLCNYIKENDTVNVRKFIGKYVLDVTVDKENDLVLVEIA